jgi:hypothetical protein
MLDFAILLASKPKPSYLVPILIFGGLVAFTLFFGWLSRRGKRQVLEYEAERSAELYSLRLERRKAQLERQGRSLEDEGSGPGVENGGTVRTTGVR